MKCILIFAGITISTWLLAEEFKVVQKSKKFDHEVLKIKAGDSISFHNGESDITHNVFSLSEKNSFELKTQAPGSSSVVVFKDQGETEVECAIHTNMRLKVIVSK